MFFFLDYFNPELVVGILWGFFFFNFFISHSKYARLEEAVSLALN